MPQWKSTSQRLALVDGVSSRSRQSRNLLLTKWRYAPVTQLVEYLVYTQAVIGSSPVGRTLEDISSSTFGSVNSVGRVLALHASGPGFESQWNHS